MMAETPRKPKILVVDDEVQVREFLSSELSSLDYDVVMAAHASEALVCLRQERIDLLVTDVRIPGEMDGISLVRVFRREKPHLKVLFITGYDVKPEIESMLRLGLTRLLTKPFTSEDFAKNVRELIGP
jgi:CheY-like chemotaxis protein